MPPNFNVGVWPVTTNLSNETHLTDEQVMIQVATGEVTALEILYDRYAATVMGIAYKMLGDRAVAEEIVQETFWRVWQRAASFEKRQGKFSNWLFGIARNLCIDRWRRNQARPQLVPHNEEAGFQIEQEADPKADVPEHAWQAMKNRQVRAAVAELPPEQRTVLEMSYFQGLTRQNIAEKTGVPLGTVHTRARLALKKLRELLQRQGFEY